MANEVLIAAAEYYLIGQSMLYLLKGAGYALAYGGKGYDFEGNRQKWLMSPSPVDFYYFFKMVRQDGIVPRRRK